MKAYFRMMIAGAGLAVAGCTSLPGANLGDTFSVEGFLNEDLQGGSYTAELAKAYQDVAADEARNDVNWYDATAFYRKGEAAAAGEEVQPWDPATFGLTGAPVQAYQQMLPVLAANKDVRPEACARMVARYDYWIEQRREGDHSCTDPGVVQEQYAKAFAECGPGFAGAGPRWIVYFGFDRFDLTSEARGVIDEVVSAVQGYSSPLLSIVGHTDTVGSKAYNQRLSERRAATVYEALEAKGIPGDAMTTAGRSELELAVPTGDGVKEPLNRRVEITASGQ